MSIRYKTALLSLASMALIYGWYFAGWAADRRAGLVSQDMLRFVTAVLVMIVIQILGAILIAVTSRDTCGAMDERERVFDRQATNVGYYVLIVGALTAAATLHIGAQARDMAGAILLAVVVGECARHAVFLILHHRAA